MQIEKNPLLLNKTHFNFLKDSFEGLANCKANYLYKLPREDDEKYSSRLFQSPYQNYFRDSISSFISHLFKKNYNRSSVKSSSVMLKIAEDADIKNNNINNFLRKIATIVKTYGTAFCLVDMKKNKEQRTLKKMLDDRDLPYLVAYTPLDIKNISIDDFGNIEFVEFLDIDNTTSGTIRFFDKNSWSITKNGVIEEGTHNLGVVPVAIISENQVGNLPDYYEIADISKAVFNLNSVADQQLRNQFLNIFVFQVENDLLKNIKDNKIPIVMSEDNAIGYTGSNRPDFISPDANTVRIIEEKIKHYEERMDKVANYMRTGLGIESGMALENRFESLNAKLLTFSMNMMDFEYNIWDIIERWLNIEINIKLDYPASFQIVTTATAVEGYRVAREIVSSKTFHKESVKRIATNLLEGLDQETTNKIFEEIDFEEDKLGNQRSALQESKGYAYDRSKEIHII